MRILFDSIRALLYAAAFLGFFGWIALGLRVYDQPLGLALRAWVVLPGVALMGLGGVLAILCVGIFVFRGRGTPAPFDPPRQFVAVGPYRYVRNPMYIGGLGLLLGLGLYLRSFSILLMTLVVFILVQLFVVFYEEPHLRRTFGAAYESYCRSTRRWLPRFHPASNRAQVHP
jgi:protein-S-isoprenylcysteine O-methyltransferase Ste14